MRSGPTPHTLAALRAAFPASLGTAVDSVVSRLPHAPGALSDLSIAPRPVLLRGEPLSIPYRVYVPPLHPPPDEPSRPLAVESKIRACVYSRHHDGHVRQAQVATLLGDSDPWLVPFVVQLLGEYVLEVAEAIAAHRDRLAEPPYQAFVLENPAFVELTRQRMRSYWNCYYRRRFPRLESYAPFRLVRELLDRGGAG